MTQLVIPKTLVAKETGNLVDFFKSYDNIVQKNSGIHDSKCLTIECLEPQCPIPEGTYTKVKLTDESVDVVNLDKSWISMKVQATVTLEFAKKDMEEGTKIPLPTFAFVGLKSSSHIIEGYRILNSNRKTGCEQTQALYENAIVHFLKPHEETQGRPNIYTPWENAYNFSTSVCGAYLNDVTFAQAAPWKNRNVQRTVTFDLTIPLDDILPLSNISMYPNYLFGNLQLEFKTTKQKNFVWCFVNQQAVMNAAKMLHSSVLFNNASFVEAKTDKCFYACGDTVHPQFCYYIQGDTPTMVGDVKTMVGDVKVSVSDLTIVECQSNINGFRIKDTVKKQLLDKYSQQTLIIPSQFIDYQQANKGPTSSVLHTSTSYTLNNVSNICVTFPQTENEVVISKNPFMSAFQLYVDNKPYPETVGSTTSSRYCEYVLSNSHLDSLWCANKSLLFALCQRSDGIGNDGNYVLERDGTNYCFNASTERLCNGEGIFCDGLTKDISLIRLDGLIDSGSKYKGEEVPSPHLFYIQTTFWVCNASGVQYVMNDDTFLKTATEHDDD